MFDNCIDYKIKKINRHFNSSLLSSAPPGCCTADGKMVKDGQIPPDCLVIEIPEDDAFYSKYGRTCFAVDRTATINSKGCTDFPPQQVW